MKASERPLFTPPRHLLVQVMNRLCGRRSHLTNRILHLACGTIERTLGLEIRIPGKPPDTLLHRSRNAGHLAPGPLLHSPAEGLARRALHVPVTPRILPLPLAVQDDSRNRRTNRTTC